MQVSNPHVSKRSGPSMVWLIPLITVIVGGWLVVKTLSEQGPKASISFKTAEGIEVGKTKIKYKNVSIGMVEQIRFSDDLSHVLISGEFDKGTDHFLRRNTRFWVVKPQFGLKGVSGLSTLISGAYIEIEPGPGAPQSHFVGLEKAPVVTANEAGKRISLISGRLGSIDTGSPIYYQGMEAGEVLGHELGTDRKSVFIHAFIKEPFDQLIRGNTRFWNVSGMEVTMGADGFKMEMESVASLVFGGIAFETPATLEPVTEYEEDLVFTLFDDYTTIKEYSYTKKINFIVFFDSSVRGLSIGAPVEFKGIKIGSVLDIRLEFESKDTTFRIPVLIEIEPERIIASDGDEQDSPYHVMNVLVERGLRAQLRTGSLLTGQLFIELDMHPDTEVLLSGTDTRVPELPTIPASNFDAITASVERFVAKLDGLEIEEIGSELLSTLRGANKVINNPEIPVIVSDLQDSLESFRSIMRKVDESNLKEAINAGHVALEKLEETLTLTNRVLKPNSPLQYNVIKLSAELEETARSIRALVETLERNPQSLIFGKDIEEE
ncbi:MAG: MCE family protein [Gammaproteobacteria bacterium]|jgi:paraquat-inducible protein B|nr:MCE family protein [Gammaproteobacteria bacterium]